RAGYRGRRQSDFVVGGAAGAEAEVVLSVALAAGLSAALSLVLSGVLSGDLSDDFSVWGACFRASEGKSVPTKPPPFKLIGAEERSQRLYRPIRPPPANPGRKIRCQISKPRLH